MTVKQFKMVNHYRFIGLWSGRHTRCGNCRNRSHRMVAKPLTRDCDIPCYVLTDRLICHACGHGFLTDTTFVCDNWVSSW